jgi:hypothetical protein
MENILNYNKIFMGDDKQKQENEDILEQMEDELEEIQDEEGQIDTEKLEDVIE